MQRNRKIAKKRPSEGALHYTGAEPEEQSGSLDIFVQRLTRTVQRGVENMTSDCIASRRKFLKTSVLGGAAATAAWRLPSARAAATTAASTATAATTSRVAIAAGDDRANIAFRSLEPFKKEIAAAIGNKQVILKPNNVIINVPLCASHADNLEGILEFLKSIGKTNVVIAESPANGSCMESFSNYGYNKFVTKYGVKLANLDDDKFNIVYCVDEKDFQPKACRMSKMLTDPNNFVISAAVLKTHDIVGVTLSLKNIVVGAAIKDNNGARGSKNDKRLTHGGGFHGISYNLFALSTKLHPDLAVIDGYQGMEGTGPVHGTAVDQKVCIASLDWLAADRVGAEMMGVDFNKIGYLKYCADAGDRGQGDLSKIEIVGPAIKDHAKTYQLPRNWEAIQSWQKPTMIA
jgi:uncharacterized protein (DUF362 family)